MLYRLLYIKRWFKMKILIGINIVLWGLYVIGVLTIYNEENLTIRLLFAYYLLIIGLLLFGY